MSYRGYVRCRCFEEGKTNDLPFGEELRSNAEGFYFASASRDKTIPLFKKMTHLEKWKKTACQHPNMELVSAVVANDMGIQGFSDHLVKNGGESRYPKTLKLLNRVGEAPIFPAEATSALTELQNLKKRSRLTSTAKSVLRERESQRIIMIGDYEDETFFAALKNNHLFLLKNGKFHIIEQGSKKGRGSSILFRAESFYTIIHRSNQVNFTQEKGEQTITSIRGLGNPQAKGSKTRYVVNTENFNDYTYWKTLIDGLEKLLIGAQKTDHAILWEAF